MRSMKHITKAREAAAIFTTRCIPDWVLDSAIGSDVVQLVTAAHTLYALEWGERFDILSWDWPAQEWPREHAFMESRTPWNVLLRVARCMVVDLYQQHGKPTTPTLEKVR